MSDRFFVAVFPLFPSTKSPHRDTSSDLTEVSPVRYARLRYICEIDEETFQILNLPFKDRSLCEKLIVGNSFYFFFNIPLQIISLQVKFRSKLNKSDERKKEREGERMRDESRERGHLGK